MYFINTFTYTYQVFIMYAYYVYMSCVLIMCKLYMRITYMLFILIMYYLVGIFKKILLINFKWSIIFAIS